MVVCFLSVSFRFCLSGIFYAEITGSFVPRAKHFTSKNKVFPHEWLTDSHPVVKISQEYCHMAGAIMRQLKTVTFLKAIHALNSPVGANYLSSSLGIPSATVGRQLKKLEDDGYLVAVGNKGRVLTPKGKAFLEELEAAENQKNAAQNLIDFASSSSVQRIRDVLQIRLQLEPYTAALSCKNATDAQLEELELLSMEHLLDLKRGGSGAQQDLAIHLAIAEFSKNEVAYQIMKILLADNNVYYTLNTISSSLKRSEITRHDEIINAIRLRDAETAGKMMRLHLEKILENVNDYQEFNSHHNN